jgi:hypothetical protein
VKGVVLALLALGGLRIILTRARRFADPDPSVYGHPRGRA